MVGPFSPQSLSTLFPVEPILHRRHHSLSRQLALFASLDALAPSQETWKHHVSVVELLDADISIHSVLTHITQNLPRGIPFSALNLTFPEQEGRPQSLLLLC